MKMDRGLVLTFCAAATAAGCATAGGAGGGTAAMPDVVCSVQPMQPSPHGSQAQAALNRTLILQGEAARQYYQTAMDQALLGLEAQPENPWHPYLAAQAAVGLDDYQAAHTYFERTAALCPELVEAEIDGITTLRQRAWATAFQRGIEAFRADDQEGAIAAWEQATVIWEGAPNAHFNLAVIQAGRGNADRALEHYREALAILGRIPPSPDEEITMERLETRAQVINGMIALGAQHFQANRYDQAAEIFREVTQAEANSRDAWYNYSLALYRMERWQELIPVAERVVQMDPLNYNAQIILFNAHRGISEAATGQAERAARDRALAVLERAEALPVRVDDITLGGSTEAGTLEISGVAAGTGQAGGPLTLEFTAYGASGQLGTGTTTVQRPARDATAPFTVTIPVAEPVTGWSYRVR
jgi:tetratricopeptide (TPR) repeat protein